MFMRLKVLLYNVLKFLQDNTDMPLPVYGNVVEDTAHIHIGYGFQFKEALDLYGIAADDFFCVIGYFFIQRKLFQIQILSFQFLGYTSDFFLQLG